MKRVILLLCFAIMASSYSNAQILPTAERAVVKNVEVVTVLKKDGKVKYAKPGSRKFKSVSQGAILSKKGRVKLKKRASLTLVENGKSKMLNAKGKHSLNNLPKTESANSDPFLASLMGASGFVGDGPRPRGGRDTIILGGGGGGEGKALIGQSPLAGNVLAKATTFAWSGKSDSGFTLNFYASSDESAKPVFSTTSSANTKMVDLAGVSELKVGGEYFWSVETKNEESSNKVPLSLMSASAADEVLTKLERTDEFKNSADWEKALRKAHALQSNGLIHDAEKIYKQATIDFPNNKAVSAMYAKLKADIK